jgi:hypothetical protein
VLVKVPIDLLLCDVSAIGIARRVITDIKLYKYYYFYFSYELKYIANKIYL